MNEHGLFKEETLHIIREVEENPSLNQRLLSQRLNISLGKTNYLLKSLVKIGLLEIRNLAVRNNRVKKMRYLITKQGFQEKIRLTYQFLKEKEAEYNLIKAEWHKLNNGKETLPAINSTSADEIEEDMME